MDKILSDPIWQGLGAILAFVGFVLSVIFYFARKKKKDLSYIFTADNILGQHKDIKSKIDFVWEGTTVENAYLLLLKFSNTGNIAISKEDFDRDISIKLPKDCHIMNYEISSKEPENIIPQLFEDDNIIRIKPLLLNKKDFFTLKILVSDYYSEPLIDLRIKDIPRIKQIKSGERDDVGDTYSGCSNILGTLGIFIILIVSNWVKIEVLFAIYMVAFILWTTAFWTIAKKRENK